MRSVHSEIEMSGALSGELPSNSKDDNDSDSSSGGISRLPRADSAREARVHPESVMNKLHLHIMGPFCLLTVLNHMDRANLAYAAVQLNQDLGFGEEVFGWAASVFFVSYAVCQIPVQLLGQRVGLAKTLGAILVAWGLIAISFAGLTSKPWHLYTLRFLLGAAEAGAFPCMWAYLTKFYAGGADLAVAWSFIASAQPLAQVAGAPLAAGLLMTDGLLGFRGWQWLFILEGVPSVLLGIWMWFRLPSTPAEAAYLYPAEQDHVLQRVLSHKDSIATDGAEHSIAYGMRCWKVWAQGLASGFAGIMRYGAMYWTPLIINSLIPADKTSGSMAVLLTAIPNTWAAVLTFQNSRHAKRTGDMYWHLLAPQAVATIGLGLLALTLNTHAVLALACLTLSATNQASNPLEFGYPATYLHGAALSSGWAIVNCVSQYGGVVGPWLIGAAKVKYGTFTAPVALLASLSVFAVLFFAALMPQLPVKQRQVENDAQTLL